MEMMFNLKEMFGDQGPPIGSTIVIALMSTKMSKGTSIQKLVIKMFI